MNIKKIITGLALLMLLSSGTANADWGDVYYCQMTKVSALGPNIDKQDFDLDLFTFSLDRSKKALVFPEETGGFFSNYILRVLSDGKSLNGETWAAGDEGISTLWYKNGDFIFSATDYNNKRVVVVIAICVN